MIAMYVYILTCHRYSILRNCIRNFVLVNSRSFYKELFLLGWKRCLHWGWWYLLLEKSKIKSFLWNKDHSFWSRNIISLWYSNILSILTEESRSWSGFTACRVGRTALHDWHQPNCVNSTGWRRLHLRCLHSQVLWHFSGLMLGLDVWKDLSFGD